MDWAKVVLWGVLFLLGWFMVGIACAPFVGYWLREKGREQCTDGKPTGGLRDTDTTEE